MGMTYRFRPHCQPITSISDGELKCDKGTFGDLNTWTYFPFSYCELVLRGCRV